MADEETEIVWPDRDVELDDGRVVTVRELRAAQEDQLHGDLVPVRNAVQDLMGPHGEIGDLRKAIRRIIDEHGPRLSRLVRACTGLTAEDWDQISADDAASLKITWLAVHLGPFGATELAGAAMLGAIAASGRSSSQPH